MLGLRIWEEAGSDQDLTLSRRSEGVERATGYQIHQKTSLGIISDVFRQFGMILEALITENPQRRSYFQAGLVWGWRRRQKFQILPMIHH